jgi:hypothetical protein
MLGIEDCSVQALSSTNGQDGESRKLQQFLLQNLLLGGLELLQSQFMLTKQPLKKPALGCIKYNANIPVSSISSNANSLKVSFVIGVITSPGLTVNIAMLGYSNPTH